MVVNEWWFMVMIWLIPSGKRLHNNGKIHHTIHGKTHELSAGPFLKAMLVINRGSRHAALSLAARTVGLIQWVRFFRRNPSIWMARATSSRSRCSWVSFTLRRIGRCCLQLFLAPNMVSLPARDRPHVELRAWFNLSIGTGITTTYYSDFMQITYESKFWFYALHI